MAKFSTNPSRFDPYKNFKFRVKWDGRYVAGVSKASALKRSAEAVEHRGAAKQSSARKVTGLRKFSAVTLERGITHDREFEAWATSAWEDSGQSGKASLEKTRRDIIIDVYNEAGRITLTYKLHKCWVSEFQAIPDLDENANAVAIQSIKLEYEGWEQIETVDPEPRR